MIKRIKTLVILTLLLFAGTVNAQEWDWWKGSHDKVPNHTATKHVSNMSELQKALNVAKGGDIIYLKSGATFSGTGVLHNKFGTKGNPIIITADPNKMFPVITNGFRMKNSHYWELSNIKLKMPESAACIYIGVYRKDDAAPMESCHNWKIENCEITDGYAGGIAVANKSSHGIIRNTRLWNLGTTSEWNEYIYLGSGNRNGESANNILIEGCELWGSSRKSYEAIEVKPDTYDITIRNNYIHDMYIVGGTTAITLGVGGRWNNQKNPKDKNYVVENNRFFNIKVGDFNPNAVPKEYGGAGCIGVGMGSTLIKNNIIVDCDKAGIHVAKGMDNSQDIKEVIIENNIIWNSGGASINLNSWTAGFEVHRKINFTYTIRGNILNGKILDKGSPIFIGNNITAKVSDFESASKVPYDKGNGPLSGFFPKASASNIVNAYTVTSNVETDILGVSRSTIGSESSYGAFESGSALDVDEFNNTIEFSISPNPTANDITIQTSDTIKIERITIFDALGKEVFATKAQTYISKVILNPNLATGIYMVKIDSDKGVLSGKIIIE